MKLKEERKNCDFFHDPNQELEKNLQKRSQLQNALISRLEVFIAALHFQLVLGILKLQMEELFHSPAVSGSHSNTEGTHSLSGMLHGRGPRTS